MKHRRLLEAQHARRVIGDPAGNREQRRMFKRRGKVGMTVGEAKIVGVLTEIRDQLAPRKPELHTRGSGATAIVGVWDGKTELTPPRKGPGPADEDHP